MRALFGDALPTDFEDDLAAQQRGALEAIARFLEQPDAPASLKDTSRVEQSWQESLRHLIVASGVDLDPDAVQLTAVEHLHVHAGTRKVEDRYVIELYRGLPTMAYILAAEALGAQWQSRLADVTSLLGSVPEEAGVDDVLDLAGERVFAALKEAAFGVSVYVPMEQPLDSIRTQADDHALNVLDFVVAHELGHIALGHLEDTPDLASLHVGADTGCWRMEIAADRFAVDVLRNAYRKGRNSSAGALALCLLLDLMLDVYAWNESVGFASTAVELNRLLDAYPLGSQRFVDALTRADNFDGLDFLLPILDVIRRARDGQSTRTEADRLRLSDLAGRAGHKRLRELVDSAWPEDPVLISLWNLAEVTRRVRRSHSDARSLVAACALELDSAPGLVGLLLPHLFGVLFAIYRQEYGQPGSSLAGEVEELSTCSGDMWPTRRTCS